MKKKNPFNMIEIPEDNVQITSNFALTAPTMVSQCRTSACCVFGRKSIHGVVVGVVGVGGESVLIICTFTITINNQSQDLNLYL